MSDADDSIAAIAYAISSMLDGSDLGWDDAVNAVATGLILHAQPELDEEVEIIEQVDAALRLCFAGHRAFLMQADAMAEKHKHTEQ